jgi:hypothetical protein
MNKIQIIVIILLVFVSVIMWTISAQQYNIMMSTMMMFYNPIALSLFTIIWTAGMAAMMFPAISPMVLLYDRLIKTNNNTSSSNDEASSQRKGEARASSLIVGRDNKEEQERMKKKILLSSVSFWSPYSFKMILFIGSYLLVWALTGIASHIWTISVQSAKNQMSWLLRVPNELLYEKVEKWDGGSSKDGNLSWVILSWMLLALLFANGSVRLDEFVMDGFVCCYNIWREGLDKRR